jgi:hypothetical protein
VTYGALTLFDSPRKAGRPRRMSVSAQWTESLRGAEHLRTEDRALMELGRRLAHAIDATDDDKTLGNLAGQLIAVVDRLGMSPKGRTQLGLLEQAPEEVSPLDDLRLIRASRRSTAVDAGT